MTKAIIQADRSIITDAVEIQTLGSIQNRNGRMTFRVSKAADGNRFAAPQGLRDAIADLDGRRVWSQYTDDQLIEDIDERLARAPATQ